MPGANNAPVNKMPEIRAGDTVVVLNGKDAGKRGKVEKILRNPSGRQKSKSGWKPASIRPVSVLVAGLNMAKKHQKPRQRMNQSSRMPAIQQGGIMDVPQPIDISNVMIVCPHCDRVSRIGHETLGTGQRVRVCKHCGDQLEAAE